MLHASQASLLNQIDSGLSDLTFQIDHVIVSVGMGGKVKEKTKPTTQKKREGKSLLSKSNY